MTDVNAPLDAISKAHSFKSERQLSRYLGISHTHLREIREQLRGPSPDLLAQILQEANKPADIAVLQLIKGQQKGRARAIIDKAIKALSAASLAVPFLVMGASDQSANADTQYVQERYIMR